MLLAALQQVSKAFSDQVVLQNANLELRDASRIALIGRNGAGKSTILNLLTKTLEADSGEIFLRQDVTVAKLEQDPQFEEDKNILDISEKAFVELDALEKRLQALETQLEKAEMYEQWEHLHETFVRRGGYERRSRRDAVLFALGFRGREDQLAASLSGGEKTRLGLAQLLMAQPDVLLLDEPTNHLDMDMRRWLENYLMRYPGAVLLVSHDREFLDKACDSTAEISFGKLRTYPGNPTQYRHYRADQLEIEAATRKREHKEYQRLQEMTRQMKIWGGRSEKLARRARSMETRTERFAAQMMEDADPTQGSTRFQFECDDSGDIVLQAQYLSKCYQDRQLFKDIHFTIRRGECIALVGPNGAGKSTFVKTLLGDVTSDDPRAVLRFGARVRVGYYDQELKGINPENTLIAEIVSMVGDVEAHNLLGKFMFPYDAQYKRIKDLSGGERARLALLKLTLLRCNFLILDEPTNHLDVDMIEALEEALAEFEGTLLVISHDRRFIETTTDFIWELKDGQLTMYPGDWAYYQSKKDLASLPILKSTQNQSHPLEVKASKGPSKWQLQRQREQLEIAIQDLEQTLSKVADQLSNASHLSPSEIADLGKQHSQLEQALLEHMAQWEATVQGLES